MKLLFLVNLISFIFSIKDFRPIKKCDISNLSFDNYLSSTPYRSGDIDTLTYYQFISQVKKANILSLQESNDIYNLLDVDRKGYFSYDKWEKFNKMFLDKFKKCDTDNDCYLTTEEFEKCFPGAEKLFFISSLKEKEEDKISFYNFVIFTKANIIFNKFKSQDNFLDSNKTFSDALELFNGDRTFTYNESLLVYYTGVNLFKRGTSNKDIKFNFDEFFFLSKITSLFLSLASTSIAEGYVTDNSFEFELYSENDKDKEIKYSFEDYAYVIFYRTLFLKYSTNKEYLTKNDFFNLIYTDMFFPNDYKVYIDPKKGEETKTIEPSKHENKFFHFSFKSISLFDTIKEENENDSLKQNIDLVFKEGAIKFKDKIYFDEFITLIKFMDLYDQIVKSNLKAQNKGITVSSSDIGDVLTNDTEHLITPHPPLLRDESFQLSKIEIMNCNEVTLFAFLSYLNMNKIYTYTKYSMMIINKDGLKEKLIAKLPFSYNNFEKEFLMKIRKEKCLLKQKKS